MNVDVRVDANDIDKQFKRLARIKNGGGYTGGFIATVGEHIGVFRRRRSARFPIDQLYGPSGTEMLNNENVREGIEREAAVRFANEFDRQVDLLLKG